MNRKANNIILIIYCWLIDKKSGGQAESPPSLAGEGVCRRHCWKQKSLMIFVCIQNQAIPIWTKVQGHKRAPQQEKTFFSPDSTCRPSFSDSHLPSKPSARERRVCQGHFQWWLKGLSWAERLKIQRIVLCAAENWIRWFSRFFLSVFWSRSHKMCEPEEMKKLDKTLD